MNNIYRLNASEIYELIKEGKISSFDVTKTFLERIKSIDDKIGAFISISEEDALNEAELADLSKNDSPLKGVPIALKDNIVSKGQLTSAASKMLHNYTSEYDATVVKRLKEANVPLIGKTNMDEFAMGSSNENSAIKNVSNPWDLQRVPGGSSGGAAAAVASMEVPIALGTDTGGSVRQPASFSGVLGLKPTYGRVSRYGLLSFGSSLDQIGILAKSSLDIAKTLEIIAGHDPKDMTSSKVEVPKYSELLNKEIKGLKIGVDKNFYNGLSDEIRLEMQKALEKLEEMGAIIVDINLKYLKYSIATYYIISSAEASSNLSRYDGVRYGYRADVDNVEDLYVKSRTEGLGLEVKRRIMIGTYVLSSGFFDAYYKKASQVRRLIRDDYLNILKEVDVIISPTSPTTAFKKGEKSDNPIEMYLSDIYTVSVSLAGLPAISVPIGFVNGLPLGMQIIGNYFKEDLLLNISHKFEEKRGKIEYPVEFK